MHVIDAHCDTLLAMLHKKQSPQFSYELVGSLGIPYLQFFAMFCPPSILKESDGFDKSKNMLEEMMQIYKGMIEESLYKPVTCKRDILDFTQTKESINPSLYSLLSIEGAYLSKGDISYIDYLYDQDVRCLSFTWNPSNEFAQGANEESKKGLSALGFKAVKRCNELGILLDVSHANDQTFYDIASISTKPFVATHSNSRYICAHRRNLSDDMLITLAHSDGVIGINYFDDFLVEKEKYKKAGVDDIIRHIEYIASVVGVRHIGLGSDFDGIERSAIGDVTQVPLIINALLKFNYKEEDVKCICSKNMIRVLSEVLSDE